MTSSMIYDNLYTPKYSNSLYLLEDDPYVVYRSFKQMIYNTVASDTAIKALENEVAQIASDAVAKQIEIAIQV